MSLKKTIDELESQANIRPILDENYQRRCAGCHISTPGSLLKQCGRCKRVSYCSVECQKMAWSKHKKVCAEITCTRSDCPGGHSEACRLCDECAQWVCEGYVDKARLDSKNIAWIGHIISKRRHKTTRVCTFCEKLFCFSCFGTAFCSFEGCGAVSCEDCDDGMMFQCNTCEKHFCYQCCEPKDEECGCKDRAVCIEACRTQATKALRELSSRDAVERLTFASEHGDVDNLIVLIMAVPGETNTSARTKVLSALEGKFDAATAWLPKTITTSIATNLNMFKRSAMCSNPGCSSTRHTCTCIYCNQAQYCEEACQRADRNAHMADCKGVWNQRTADRAASFFTTSITAATPTPAITTATPPTATTISTAIATAASHGHAERVCDEFLQELEREEFLEERRKKKSKRKKKKNIYKPEEDEAEGTRQSGDAMEDFGKNLATLTQPSPSLVVQSQSAPPISLSSTLSSSTQSSSLSSSSSSSTPSSSALLPSSSSSSPPPSAEPSSEVAPSLLPPSRVLMSIIPHRESRVTEVNDQEGGILRAEQEGENMLEIMQILEESHGEIRQLSVALERARQKLAIAEEENKRTSATVATLQRTLEFRSAEFAAALATASRTMEEHFAAMNDAELAIADRLMREEQMRRQRAAIEEEMRAKAAEVEAVRVQEVRELRERDEAMQAHFEHLQEARLCEICLYRPKCTVFNCGHQACSECALVIANCHHCRKPIHTRTRTFD